MSGVPGVGEQGSGSHLGRGIARIVGTWKRPRAADEAVGMASDPVARRGLEDLARDVERLETRLNLILGSMLASLAFEIYRSLVSK